MLEVMPTATAQVAARRTLSQMAMARDGFSPALSSWGVATEAPALPTKFGQGILSVLSHSAREVLTNCSMKELNHDREKNPDGNYSSLPNIQFPIFKGDQLQTWKANCLTYFHVYNIKECMWVIAATMHMEGKAKHWLQEYKMQHELGSWNQFIDAVQEKFGKYGHCQPMIELSEVRQWGEVKEGTLAQAEQIRSKTQANVADMIRDKEVQDMLEQHDLLKQLALGRNNFLCEDMVSEEEKEVPIQDSVVWDRAEQEELDELPYIDVVWDKVLSDVTTHESLLQKLVMGTEDLTDEKVKLSVKIVDAGQEFEEMSDKVAMWDDESPFCLDAQDGLLQQLALWWGVHG